MKSTPLLITYYVMSLMVKRKKYGCLFFSSSRMNGRRFITFPLPLVHLRHYLHLREFLLLSSLFHFVSRWWFPLSLSSFLVSALLVQMNTNSLCERHSRTSKSWYRFMKYVGWSNALSFYVPRHEIRIEQII